MDQFFYGESIVTNCKTNYGYRMLIVSTASMRFYEWFLRKEPHAALAYVRIRDLIMSILVLIVIGLFRFYTGYKMSLVHVAFFTMLNISGEVEVYC